MSATLLAKYDSIPLKELVDFIITRRHFLLPAEIAMLRMYFGAETPTKTEASIDIAKEVSEQLHALKTLRSTLIHGNQITGSPKEVKDLISASTSLLSLLSKTQEDIWNQDRIRSMELTLLSILNDLDPELKDKFVAEMERRLGD